MVHDNSLGCAGGSRRIQHHGAFIGTRHGKFNWGKFVLFFRQPTETDKGKAGDGAIGDYNRSAALSAISAIRSSLMDFSMGMGQGAHVLQGGKCRQIVDVLKIPKHNMVALLQAGIPQMQRQFLRCHPSTAHK